MNPLSILSFLRSPLARWLAIGLVIAFAGLQTVRLGHAKHDLTEARSALIDPATKKTWRSEAEQRAADLNTCHGNVAELDRGLKAQTEAVDALKSDSDRRGRELAQALQAARKAASAAQSKADRLAAFTPEGKTVCEQLLSVDAEVNGATR